MPVNKGEEIYRQALELMKRAKDIEGEKEQERSHKMYEEWKKTQEKESKPKTPGVVVIKTLVKKTRKDRTNNDARRKRNEAVELMKQAADEFNHPEAAVQLGNMLLNDASRSINNNNRQDESESKDLVTRAMTLFRRAGESGSRVGWYNLGHLLWTGFPPRRDDEGEMAEDDSVGNEVPDNRIIVANIQEAMNAFTKAIDLGDRDAMYLVGVHRLTENDGENYGSGIKLIERAADAGHGGALYYLALLVSTSRTPIGMDILVNIIAKGIYPI